MPAFKFGTPYFVKYYSQWGKRSQQCKFQRESLEDELKDKSVLPISIARSLSSLSTFQMSRSVVQILKGSTNASADWSEIRRHVRHLAIQLFSHIEYVDSLVEKAKTTRTQVPAFYQLTFTDINTGSLIWAASIAFGQTQIAKRWGDRLLAEVVTRGALIEHDIYELIPFEIWTMYVHAKWQKTPFIFPGPFPKNWQIYQEVIDSWENEFSFSKAINNLCDFHCKNCYERSSGLNIPFLQAPFDIFPAEILALLCIRRELGLSVPECDHPLIRDNPMAIVPSNIEIPLADELERKVMAHIRRFIPKFRLVPGKTQRKDAKGPGPYSQQG